MTSTVVPALFSGTQINLSIATFFSNGGTFVGNPTNGARTRAHRAERRATLKRVSI
jgi:hypothetical protein